MLRHIEDGVKGDRSISEKRFENKQIVCALRRHDRLFASRSLVRDFEENEGTNRQFRVEGSSGSFMLRSRHHLSITSALKRQSVPIRKPGNSPRRSSL